jgi:hypothetical protein
MNVGSRNLSGSKLRTSGKSHCPLDWRENSQQGLWQTVVPLHE